MEMNETLEVRKLQDTEASAIDLDINLTIPAPIQLSVSQSPIHSICFGFHNRSEYLPLLEL